ncbi:hypothetical protein ACVGVM_21475 [Pseudonocardia bannensis]|uniref:Uncharacterized protein n=1 Tax=Pseudonocardia bannensis TaxID=630973 RepID=A0A848DSH2_9PSEU|nr:hypothetical protein [Pseudonocardia bannensis]NMH95439.1 hypothetical protein [Pseudonocardia bannensis]
MGEDFRFAGAPATLKAGPAIIQLIVDLVPGAASAAPGQSGGLLVDLTPGRYFLVCPVGDEGEQPHHLRGMIDEITVT